MIVERGNERYEKKTNYSRSYILAGKGSVE